MSGISHFFGGCLLIVFSGFASYCKQTASEGEAVLRITDLSNFRKGPSNVEKSVQTELADLGAFSTEIRIIAEPERLFAADTKKLRAFLVLSGKGILMTGDQEHGIKDDMFVTLPLSRGWVEIRPTQGTALRVLMLFGK